MCIGPKWGLSAGQGPPRRKGKGKKVKELRGYNRKGEVAIILYCYCCTDGIVMILHYREVGDICYIFHHGATIYAFYFVMVSY